MLCVGLYFGRFGFGSLWYLCHHLTHCSLCSFANFGLIYLLLTLPSENPDSWIYILKWVLLYIWRHLPEILPLCLDRTLEGLLCASKSFKCSGT